jgi:hypothetical protein
VRSAVTRVMIRVRHLGHGTCSGVLLLIITLISSTERWAL